jgi:hypothetical protein
LQPFGLHTRCPITKYKAPFISCGWSTVLDRLLALNHQRYAAELAAGLHEKKSKAKNPATKRVTKKAKGYEPPPDLFPPAQPDLFG